MNAWHALLIGGAVVGAAVLITRRRRAGDDECAELGKLDVRAGAACRLWGGPVGEFIRDGAAGIGAIFEGIADDPIDYLNPFDGGEGFACRAAAKVDPTIKCPD